ncbi:FagA protein [Zestomonas carbonaria]|uniref:FagA protein n=1 Tax=Zestomonas carbonaria TaxID=2762745 RepID=A0A7U7EKM9_9GAMM|nr:FagA protein [Pseudomonas carbonaria]CAD5106778.1 hypothetical protein PSEWESI4_01045 [Pseudomonas carbonaria]
MKTPWRQTVSLDNWHWLKTKIRCALAADDPQLIDQFMAETQVMVGLGRISPWRAAEAAFRLLLDTAHDYSLPWHWRCLCLDHAYRPLRDLERLARGEAQRYRLSLLGRQLALTELIPSLPYLELEGKRHD